MKFEKKELEQPKRVCFRLKEAREKRGLSLDFVCRKMKMSKKWVQALEHCDFDQIPFAPIYKRNLIKNYCKTLGLDPTTYIEQYETEEVAPEPSTAISPYEQKFSRQRAFNIPSLFKTGIVALIALILLGYIGFEVRNILRPPKLFLTTPIEGSIVYESPVEVRGFTEKEARVYLNGQEIQTDLEGNFSHDVDLKEGLNTIIVGAEKKHGKNNSLTRHVTFRLPLRETSDDIEIEINTSTPTTGTSSLSS
ncbi:helix-turn-helix domain-containing protein [Candidatus Nomurabacteria bacterium]|nr:helix-turn-helix domain-containing protein [Candidatus Nomurabacteria bacterium]